MENLKEILHEANFKMNDIVKTSIFLKSMDNFGEVMKNMENILKILFHQQGNC